MGEIIEYKTCLLITGTIIPNSIYVEHTNINKRLDEYYEALIFYATQFKDYPIYFLENSEYNFNDDLRFQKLFLEKNITLFKFPKSDKFSQGKGYQEFEMLDHSVEKLHNQYDAFIKITGRYKVLNLKQIINFKCPNLIADIHRKPGVVQTNVFYSSFDFYYSHLKNAYKLVDDSKNMYIEHVIYNKIKNLTSKNNVSLFSLNPIIIGTSGSYGGTLNRNKYKMLLRNLERKLLRLFSIKEFLIEY